MIDSPVGVAAWIIEKYHAWSDITDDNIESAHNLGIFSNFLSVLGN